LWLFGYTFGRIAFFVLTPALYLLARNAVHHDWLQALLLTPRGYGEGGFGEGYFGGSIWRWKPSEQLVPNQADRDANRSTARCWRTDRQSARFALWRKRYPSMGLVRNGH
jgi:hypothetical protein